MRTGWLGLLIWPALATAAAGFSITEAHTELRENVYHVSAEIKYALSDQVMEALHNGVAITVTVDMGVYRERSYIWDEEVAELKQSYQIRYQALTKQYMVKNLNTGSVDNFNNIDAVFNKLGVLENFPLIDAKLIDTGARHYTLVRSRIDLDSLPVPLRLRAYFSSAWDLESKWYECEM